MKFAKFFCLTLFLTIIITFGQAQTQQDSLNIYPNPFCKTTTIHFDIIDNDTVTLVIYNRFGETVRRFFSNSLLPSGSYFINFSGDTLVDGVYILSFQYGIHKRRAEKLARVCSASIQDPIRCSSNFFFYPNPVKDWLTISIEGLKTIIITNMQGQIIKTIETESKTISLADLAKGTYIFSVFNKDKKLLIMKPIVHEK